MRLGRWFRVGEPLAVSGGIFLLMLRLARAALRDGRLCGVFDLVRLAVLSMGDEGLLEHWQLPLCLCASEALLGLEHACGGPAQGHFGIASARHARADLSDDAVHGLDDIGAGQ